MNVTKLSVGPYDNNVYLLGTVLVDGANEADRILAALGGAPLTAILQTHGHFDHIQALPALVAATGATVYCHRDDADLMPVPVELLEEGDVFEGLEVIHLAGHTPGGLAFLHETTLFSGDSLFPGGIGKTTDETFDQLFGDVTTKIFDRLPDETVVHPGHGKDTTLGAERPSLPEWRARRW